MSNDTTTDKRHDTVIGICDSFYNQGIDHSISIIEVNAKFVEHPETKNLLNEIISQLEKLKNKK